jgi:hypothetical protein
MATMVIIIGLLVISVLLAGCNSDASAADNSFGLRSDAVTDLVEVEPETEVEGDSVADSVAEATVSEQAVAGQPVADQVAADVLTSGGYGNGGNGAGGNGNSNQAQTADRTYHDFDPETAPALTASEEASLVYMREEEKLARDVYTALYDLWGLPVFQNIANSEQAHMDSILYLLDQYGVADPVAANGAGEFSNSELQTLYDDLVAEGANSIVDALTVGAKIEEIDILDLQAELDETGNEYIIQVYSNLLAGSENHLRSFVLTLERQNGEIYGPYYLGSEAYDAIMASATDRGNGYGNGGNGGNGGGFGGGRNGGNGGNGRGINSNA